MGLFKKDCLAPDKIIELSLERFKDSGEAIHTMTEARRLVEELGSEDARWLAWARREYYSAIGNEERALTWLKVERLIAHFWGGGRDPDQDARM